MGNQGCCQNIKTENGNLNVGNGGFSKVTLEQFMARNRCIREFFINNQNVKEEDIKNRQSFLILAKDFTIDDGVFIGRNYQRSKLRNGYGIMLYTNKQYYEGNWLNDMREGKGIFASQTGQYYNGDWANDLADGKGFYKSKQEEIQYDGDWVSGNKEGEGIQKYADGSTYQGEFMNGMKDGKGKLTYLDGTYYEGNFKENQIEGQGVYHGKKHHYQGGWRYGKMHGVGKSTWFNNSGQIQAKYVGQYSNGIKSGFGQYTDSRGIVYKANWQDGQINERCPIITQNPF